MKVELKLDPALDEPWVEVHAPALTDAVQNLLRQLSQPTETMLFGFRDQEIIPLPKEKILRIGTEGQKVFAELNGESYTLRERLYELEEKLNGSRIVRISNSEMVNFDQVTSLDLSLSGTITLRMTNGTRSYVSRRYIERIRKYLGL